MLTVTHIARLFLQFLMNLYACHFEILYSIVIVKEFYILILNFNISYIHFFNISYSRSLLVQQLAKDECVINLLAGIPNYQTNPSQCNNEITDSGLVFENHLCGIAFSYDNWNETKYLQLYGAVDNKINIKDRIVFLRLYNPLISNANASLFMWRNIVLPDVKVLILFFFFSPFII